MRLCRHRRLFLVLLIDVVVLFVLHLVFVRGLCRRLSLLFGLVFECLVHDKITNN